MMPIDSPVICDCCASSATRVLSALRLSMPVNWSITASLRCWMSERISGVESTATHSSSATGAITSTGSRMI